jgi:hypothetical protein
VSRFFRAGISAVVVGCVFALVPVSALARYPDDHGHHYGQLSNPGHHYGQLSNPGHHYGQLKHQQAPAPAPAPAPHPQPETGGTTANHPKAGGPATDTAGIPDLTVPLPVQTVGAGQIDFSNGSSGGAQEWWVLLILPFLLALWLLIAARGALAATRRRTRRAEA